MELKLNAILKEEAKPKIIEVKRSTFYGGKPTGQETDLYIGRTRVAIRQGIVQSELPVDGPISKEIMGFIVGVRAEFTMHEDMLGVTREKGKYSHPEDPETTGTVEFYMRGVSSISCYGPTRERVLELYELIRNGAIRPDESFETPQLGKSRAQLEAELKNTQQQLGEAWAKNEKLATSLLDSDRTVNNLDVALEQTQDELTKIREQRDRVLNLLNSATADQARLERELQQVRDDRDLARSRVMAVQQLAAKLYEWSWPWCRKSTIADSINCAINDAPSSNDLHDGASDNS